MPKPKAKVVKGSFFGTKHIGGSQFKIMVQGHPEARKLLIKHFGKNDSVDPKVNWALYGKASKHYEVVKLLEPLKATFAQFETEI